jgi:hypothetical protein
MTALRPGQSPPPVETAMRRMVCISCVEYLAMATSPGAATHRATGGTEADPNSTAAQLAHGPRPAARAAADDAAGAVGVHIGGTVCRAAAGFDEARIWRGALPADGVAAAVNAIADAVRRVSAAPRYVAVGTPGHVDGQAGTVSGAANLGPEWAGTVPLGRLLRERLQCEVVLRNSAEVALEAETTAR